MSRASSNANAVVRSVTDLLNAENIWNMRIQTGGLMGAKRFIRFGKKGAADVLALVNIGPFLDENPCLPLWVEAKSGSGRQSPAQKEFQAEVEAAGHSYIIAHDGPEAVVEWLKEHGVITNGT